MGDFIRSCENDLPKDDGHGLLHTISRWQQQQDSNEFLNQLLDALGESAFKPRAKASGGAAEAEMERIEDTDGAHRVLYRKAGQNQLVKRAHVSLLQSKKALRQNRSASMARSNRAFADQPPAGANQCW